ncbi:MAG: DUF1849 family protein [Rhodospirillaceae bacterium]|nr:DUF1849 family protein [Rhodospirillaceae bacterium]
MALPALIAGLVAAGLLPGQPARAEVALVSHRAVYDLVAELEGVAGQRDAGTLTYTFAQGCGRSRVDMVLETSSQGEEDTVIVTSLTLAEVEADSGERYEMTSVSLSSTLNQAGAVVNTERGEVAAIGEYDGRSGQLSVIDRTFDVSRSESLDLGPDTMFPIHVLRERLERAAAGETDTQVQTLSPSRTTLVAETATVISEVDGAEAFLAGPEAAALLDHPGWRFHIERVDDGNDPLREEDSVILENGIVVDSIYITGRLRSIATLATVERVPDLACE